MARAVQPPGPRAVELVEEAVWLLRRHPRDLVVYHLATAPFALGLVYFWAYVAWFVPADGAVAAAALLLALLFGVMKAGQNRLGARLLARQLGEEPPAWGWRDRLAETAAQLREQCSGVVLVPLAVLFVVPFAWVYGHYQTATVLPRSAPGEPPRHAQAWALAQLRPVQNHWALLILAGLWLAVFLNLAVAFYLLPALATQWLGLKTVFAISGWSMFNTTFLMLVAGLTHLCVDPLIKAYFVLRVFHGRSLRTGEDLRLVVRRERPRGRLAAPLALVLLAVGVLSVLPAASAAESTASAARTAPAQLLDPALDRVLEQPDFRWRLRPAPPPPGQEKEGVIKGFVRTSFQVLAQMVRTVFRWFDSLRRWVGGWLPGGGDDEAGGPAARRSVDWLGLLQWSAFILIVSVAGLLVFALWKVWAHNRASVPLAGAVAAPLVAPDLRDENVEASRLPAEGWLALAHRQMAAGEWRLALRALFLATLAQRAHEGLLSLARFKTNLDYETELRRRARQDAALVDDFRRRRRQFEDVWYGAVPASDAVARDWLQDLEGRP